MYIGVCSFPIQNRACCAAGCEDVKLRQPWALSLFVFVWLLWRCYVKQCAEKWHDEWNPGAGFHLVRATITLSKCAGGRGVLVTIFAILAGSLA
eukprot:2942117-Amphidinium_carterae.2